MEDSETLKEKPAPRHPRQEIKEDQTIRLLLLGHTGSGKSSTGNTILGNTNIFKTGLRSNGVTKQSQLESGQIGGQAIEIMDTPGLFDPETGHEELVTELLRACLCLDPGPDAVLYVLSLASRFTEEQVRAYDRLKTYLGRQVTDHLILIFTHGDELQQTEDTMETYLSEATPALRLLLKECGNRYIVFDNKNPADGRQVEVLVSMIWDRFKGNRLKIFLGHDVSESAVSSRARQLARDAEKYEAVVHPHSQKLQQEISDLYDKLAQAWQAKQDIEEQSTRISLLQEERSHQEGQAVHTTRALEKTLSVALTRLREVEERHLMMRKKMAQEKKLHLLITVACGMLAGTLTAATGGLVLVLGPAAFAAKAAVGLSLMII